MQYVCEVQHAVFRLNPSVKKQVGMPCAANLYLMSIKLEHSHLSVYGHVRSRCANSTPAGKSIGLDASQPAFVLKKRVSKRESKVEAGNRYCQCLKLSSKTFLIPFRLIHIGKIQITVVVMSPLVFKRKVWERSLVSGKRIAKNTTPTYINDMLYRIFMQITHGLYIKLVPKNPTVRDTRVWVTRYFTRQHMT